MTIDYTLSQMEAVLGASSKHVHFHVAWGWCTRLVLGGLVVAFLIGAVQDALRIAAIQAEPATAPVIVISKDAAWLRIHRRLRPAPARPSGPSALSAR